MKIQTPFDMIYGYSVLRKGWISLLCIYYQDPSSINKSLSTGVLACIKHVSFYTYTTIINTHSHYCTNLFSYSSALKHTIKHLKWIPLYRYV